jgi:hypothetical protein
MYKNKMERMKDNDTSGKNTEDQNQCIRMFAEGRENRNRGELNFLGKRESSNMDLNDLSIKNLTMKHLIFFLENDAKYRKSKYLFKAYMCR